MVFLIEACLRHVSAVKALGGQGARMLADFAATLLSLRKEQLNCVPVLLINCNVYSCV